MPDKLTAQIRDRICSETLNTYLFDHVWNEPAAEFRSNISPIVLRKGAVVGTLSLYDTTLVLPESGVQYYVWAINTSDTNLGLDSIPTDKWITSDSLANDSGVLMHMYGVSGAIFHKKVVYLRRSCEYGAIFIAAEKDMVLRCIPQNSIDNVYITFYYDSDGENSFEILSICPETSMRVPDYQRQVENFLAKADKPDQITIFQNGLEVTDLSRLPQITVGEYVDYVIDRNILYSFDVDVMGSNDDPVYLSETDKCWKQLIHIPRHLNPDNLIITHNTCDFYIRQADSDTVRGYYVHRASSRTVSQVTHNDFGIPLFVMDAYRDYLASQLITVHVVVRNHGKDNYLVRDASFIDLLYCDSHDDSDIVRILTGKGPKEITWWLAANLETSLYVKMMFDTPNFNDIAHMTEYVGALGFYHTIEVLCQRVADTPLGSEVSNSYTYSLPALYYGQKILPVVYKDGQMIDDACYQYEVNEDNTLSVSFDSRIDWRNCLRTTVFYVDGDNRIFTTVPSDLSLTTTVPFTDVSVYEIITTTDERYPKGISGESSTVYRELNTGSNQYSVTDNGDGSATVTFNATLTGHTFLICNRYCTHKVKYELDALIETGQTIAIRAETNGQDGSTYPILNFRNVSVYLNRVYLVNGVDYFINTVTDSLGNIAMREIVVQTMDHFLEEGNELEVLFHMAECEDLSSGFMVGDRLQDDTPVNLYFPRLSLAHVDGKLEREVSYEGLYMSVPEDRYSTGAIFEIQTSIPQFVIDYVEQYAENIDLERIKVMNKYFYELTAADRGTIYLDSKHRIYSVHLNSILWDIAQGKSSLVDDPDQNRFLSQLEAYDYLRDMDLCYRGLDQRFIDYYPQYVNYTVDATTLRLLERIIGELMPANQYPTQEVVYTSTPDGENA